VVGALALSIPLSVWSSRVSFGQTLRRMGLFLTPEEVLPPAELRATSKYHKRPHRLPGFIEAVVDPITNALMCACGKKRPALLSSARVDRFKLLQSALRKGPAGLSHPEKRKLLNDPDTLFQLHVDVWESSNANPQWRHLIAAPEWLHFGSDDYAWSESPQARPSAYGLAPISACNDE
jgi:membrane glycosyltransferase